MVAMVDAAAGAVVIVVLVLYSGKASAWRRWSLLLLMQW